MSLGRSVQSRAHGVAGAGRCDSSGCGAGWQLLPEMGLSKVVKPHTPLIKFPDRKSGPRPKIQESLQASMPSLLASKAQESVGGISPAFQSISPVSRVQGTPDTSELTRTLPQKYRRRQMSDEEIEYIQRGGPE
ncbi:alpha-ketoglutarate dehydrogenase component 4 isoform X1 [Vidua chalybeata]|uniref:alpha-ketoglutarate dehydrogenase component 4 isoform X1 n=1 Tax=Vidua chalybeata TaxID=81927 RepID=UPI0023A7DAAB|nr:alpha-ketoglutarate dehydrogenase component 4 isoform X1 [Vidua chalybeata]